MFDGADSLIVTEIYSAGEESIEGVSGEILCNAIRHDDREFIPALDEGIAPVVSRARAGDVILCLGAGSIGQLPEKILHAVKELSSKPALVA